MTCDYCGKKSCISTDDLEYRPIVKNININKMCLLMYYENKIDSVCRTCHKEHILDIKKLSTTWDKNESTEFKCEQIYIFYLNNLLKLFQKQITTKAH